jgi:hypothetical protein
MPAASPQKSAKSSTKSTGPKKVEKVDKAPKSNYHYNKLTECDFGQGSN